MDQGRGGDTLVIRLREEDFSMFLVAMERITARPTKFMSLTLVGYHFFYFLSLVFIFLFISCPRYHLVFCNSGVSFGARTKSGFFVYWGFCGFSFCFLALILSVLSLVMRGNVITGVILLSPPFFSNLLNCVYWCCKLHGSC